MKTVVFFMKWPRLVAKNGNIMCSRIKKGLVGLFYFSIHGDDVTDLQEHVTENSN